MRICCYLSFLSFSLILGFIFIVDFRLRLIVSRLMWMRVQQPIWVRMLSDPLCVCYPLFGRDGVCNVQLECSLSYASFVVTVTFPFNFVLHTVILANAICLCWNVLSVHTRGFIVTSRVHVFSYALHNLIVRICGSRTARECVFVCV